MSSRLLFAPCKACTMENNLRSVALLNTKGIHALVMGRKHFVPRALQAFKRALEDLEKMDPNVSHSHSCRSTSNSNNTLEAFNSSPVSTLDQAQDPSFYVYNRAVFFKPLSDTSSIGLTFYKAILQFNLALAHHIKALNGQNHKSLSRALRYYKTCLKTLRELGVCGSMADRPPYPGGGESMIYLRLAALNNLAHTYSLAGDSTKVQDTLARVFQFTVAQRPLLFTPASSQEMEDCSTSSTNTLVGRRPSMNSAFVNEVLLNVMVSSAPVAGAGAA